jgi:membrane associated rhomboid family serine protease
MAFLAVFGTVVENAIGGGRLLVLYALATLGGGLLHVVVAPGATEALVGASGAIFGILGVAATLRPRLLGFALAFGGIEVWHAVAGGNGSVSFGCHIGGLAAGVVFAVLLRATGDEAFEAT